MKTKAFTLIEIMISLLLISIIVLIAAIKYDISGELLAKQEMNTVITDIKTAREIAMVSGRTVKIALQSSSYRMYIGWFCS